MLLRRPLLQIAGFSLVVNLLLLVPSLFMLQVFDRVLSSRSVETLVALLLGTAVALLLLFMLDHVRSRLQGVAGQMVTDALSPVVARRSVVLGARLDGCGRGDAMRDIGALRGVFSAQGLLALFDAPWLIVYLAVIALAHPLLGLTATCSALLMLALALLNDRLHRRAVESLQPMAVAANRDLEVSLANAEVLQAMGMTEALLDRWRGHSAEVARCQAQVAGRTVALAAFTRMFRQAVQVAMMAVGAWVVVRGEGSPGVLIACTVLLGRALAPLEQVVSQWRVLAEGREAWRRLDALLGGSDPEDKRMSLPAPRGELIVEQLIYRAPGSERLLLAGVSLALPPGSSLAIIGPSGAGKSTLLRLLIGLWAPTAGSVRLDGAELAQWPRADLGPWVGYVPQDVELFPGTVAENIARLGPVDGERVVATARRAGVHEMILALPQGYDTPVEMKSALLSPGQRQRIALARALYGEPRLLVLDEPNANLDGVGEAALAEVLQRLQGEVTVVLVTHRQPLVQHVDQLLVLEAGRVVQQGPRAQVLQRLQHAASRPSSKGRPLSEPLGSAV